MYSIENDDEEKARKIAQQLFIKQNAQKDLNSTMKPPAIDIPPPAVAAPEVPQTMMDQMRPYLDKLGQGAADYSGQGFGNPNIPAVQRGGGMLTPGHMEMGDFASAGDVGSMGILEAITKNTSNGSGDGDPQDWPEFLQKMLQNKLTKMAGI
tara:strand:+ start:44 stop:499 length:456 start_codon:yes stop_codon:yes gene_type:complete